MALVVALLALVAAPSANAFDTQPHNDITQSALREEGFGGPAAEAVAVENFFPDLYTNDKQNPFSGQHAWYHPLTVVGGATFHNENWDQPLREGADRLHFDPHDANGTSNTAEIEREWERLQRGTTGSLATARNLWERSKSTGNAQQADDAALIVLASIGVSLHSLQDFYAHTNWVETKAVAGGDGPDWAARGQGTTPTWFDLPKGIRDGAQIYAGRAVGHRPHGGWNTNLGQNVHSGVNKDWPGRPFFSEADESAYFATRQWVRALRKWLNDDALWAHAQDFAQRRKELQRDLRDGAYATSVYSGHWQGQGEPCNPKADWPAPIGTGQLECGERNGDGGNLKNLRSVTSSYFKSGKTRFRLAGEAAIRQIGAALPAGETFPVESSRDIQQSTQFVRLQVLNYRGIDLGDLPPAGGADVYARANIAGQNFDSAIINGHDSFSFPRPYHPFTWLKPVPVGGTYSEPVETITINVRTANDRGAGTNDDVFLRLGPNLRFPLDKRTYDDFERDDRDTYSVPIDAITRSGLSVGDIEFVQIEKSRDGSSWKLGGIDVQVNGRAFYKKVRIEQWLQKNRRVWRAEDFVPSAALGQALPVWLDLRDDDHTIGGDDQGDVNPFDARDAVARGYTPGTVLDETTKGGEKFKGRLGKDGDDARVRFQVDTLQVQAPPPFPEPSPQPEPEPEPEPEPGEDPPPPPPPGKPDLVISALGINEFTVTNQGTGPAGAFMVTPVGYGTFTFNGLAAGQSATRQYSSGCNPAPEARADSLFQVDESDESNNVRQIGQVLC